MALFDRSEVTLLGKTDDRGEFFQNDLDAVAAQSGANGIAKFNAVIDGLTTIGVFALDFAGDPLTGGTTKVAAKCPPHCDPPASPSNPLAEF